MKVFDKCILGCVYSLFDVSFDLVEVLGCQMKINVKYETLTQKTI